MNDLPKLYFTMQTHLFPMLEEEIGELTEKMKEFLRIVEVVHPSRFISDALRWCGLGRPMKDREKMLRAFFSESSIRPSDDEGADRKFEDKSEFTRALRLGISRRSSI